MRGSFCASAVLVLACSSHAQITYLTPGGSSPSRQLLARVDNAAGTRAADGAHGPRSGPWTDDVAVDYFGNTATASLGSTLGESLIRAGGAATAFVGADDPPGAGNTGAGGTITMLVWFSVSEATQFWFSGLVDSTHGSGRLSLSGVFDESFSPDPGSGFTGGAVSVGGFGGVLQPAQYVLTAQVEARVAQQVGLGGEFAQASLRVNLLVGDAVPSPSAAIVLSLAVPAFLRRRR